VGNRVTMTAATGWVITDNGTTPVALVKTGIYNDLDLTGGGPNTYTGGTAILGGEVIVSSADQLSIGPILIANGGRLKVTQTTTFANTLKGVTGGTPGVVWWNGSVIEVDEDQTATFTGQIDNTLSPSTPFEKVGQGTLFFEYRVGGAPTAYPRGSSNQWGLKLTEGLVSVNQLPLGPATGNPDNGFLVCLGGDMIVRPAPLGTSTADPNYGFSGIASFQGTTSTLTVQDGALLRANGRWEHTFMGTVILAAQDSDGDPRNNVFHFSHNGTSEGPPIRDSRGTGTVDLRGGMVAMTTNGNFLAVMPQETDFTLRMNGGIYNGMPEATLNGNLTINALLPTGGPRIDGEVFSADRSVVAPTSWTIAGTGATAWRGTLEKVGPGIVTFSRSPGAPVTVAPPSTLRISGGTVNAGGAADPFTDTAVTGALLDIDNNATFNVTAGSKQLNGLSGGGGTTNVAGGAALTVQNAVQNVLSLGAGASVTLRSAFGASQVSTLDAANASPGTATLSVAGGQTLTVAGAGGWFSIGPGSTLLKTGPGTLDINQPQSNGAGSTLTVAAGTVILSTDAGATGLPPAYAPGLVVGRLSGAFDTTSPNPATAVQAGVAQMNYAGYWDGIVWVDNATWVYSGQFYEDDGQVSFAENFDDNVLLRVDVNGNGVFDPGETWLNDVTWNSPTTSGPQALAAGQWYNFEARFGQGLGGIGPVSGWFVGLGWDTLGRGTLNPADYVTPPDSMFRRSLGGTPGTSVLLGDTSGAADASLLISGPYTVSWGITVQSGSAGNITLGGTNTSGTATFAGNVSLARSATLTAAAGGTVAFTGTVSGAGGVTKTGGGTVALSGSNIQYTGPTTVSGGLLRLSDATAFASAITDNAAVEFQATTGTWTFSQPLGGTGTVAKSGDGTLVLTAANSYNGGTTVSAGTLLVNNTTGSGTGSGTVTVGAATLGGTGFINGPVTLTDDSTLTSTGTLTIKSTLTVQGLANQIAGGTVNTSGDVTIDPGAVFIINGTLGGDTGDLIVRGMLMGKGTINKSCVIEAGGVLSPGAPSTIQTTTQILNAEAPQTFSFEIGAATPNYATPSNSVNDVIRLTNATTPFADATGGAAVFGADTVIDVYFLDNDPALGGYKTEFFAATDFTDAVAGATHQYWRLDPRGSRYHNGNFYSPLDESLVAWSVVRETATFGGASTSGYITEFTVVPEPATLALVALGGLALLSRRRK
jgi:autotransporter-associated beta strand protein